MIAIAFTAALVLGQAPSPAKAWHKIQMPDRTEAYVWGWEPKPGTVRWHPEEQPDGQPAREMPPVATPGPSHDELPMGGGRYPWPGLNYGVRADKLASDKRTVRASDPDTLRLVQDQSGNKHTHDPGKPCPGPNCEPEKRKPELPDFLGINRLDAIPFYVGAGVLVVAAFLILAHKPNRGR